MVQRGTDIVGLREKQRERQIERERVRRVREREGHFSSTAL